MVGATSKGSDQPAHTRSLIRAFACRLNILTVKLLTEHNLKILSLKRGCTGSSESGVRVYTCQNATLLEITCQGSFNPVYVAFLFTKRCHFVTQINYSSNFLTFGSSICPCVLSVCHSFHLLHLLVQINSSIWLDALNMGRFNLYISLGVSVRSSTF